MPGRPPGIPAINNFLFAATAPPSCAAPELYMLRKTFLGLAVLVMMAALGFHAASLLLWPQLGLVEEVNQLQAGVTLFNQLLPAVIAIVLGAFVCYLISFDSKRPKRPWAMMLATAFLAASTAGTHGRLAYTAFGLQQQQVPTPDAFWVVFAVGAGLIPVLLIVGFEWINRMIWPKAAAHFDRKESAGLALTSNRLALLFKPGQKSTLRSVALARFRRGARGDVIHTLQALYDAGIRDPDILAALCKYTSEESDWAAHLKYLGELYEQLPEEQEIREAYLEALIEQRRFQEALKLMEKHGVDQEEEALARYAQLLLAEGQVERACVVAKDLGDVEGIPFRRSQALLREVLSRVSDYIPALNTLAAQAERMALKEQRLRWLEKSLAANPRQDEVREKLILIYRDLAQTQRLEQLLREKLRDHPGDPQLRLEYAELLHQNGRTEQALENLEELISRPNPPAKAYALQAQIFFENRDWDQVRRFAEQGLKHPQAAQVEKILQGLLRRVDQEVLTQEVAAVLDQARNNPQDVALQMEALNKLINGGHAEKVVAQADHILAHHPEEREAVVARLQRYADDPKVPFRILNLLADLLANSGRYEETISVITIMGSRAIDRLATIREGAEKILRRSPHHLPTLSLLGDTYREHGKYTEMIHAYSLYLSQGGDETEEIDRALADAYIALEDYENARRFVRTLLDNEQADNELLERVIPLALKADKPEDAAEYLKLLELRDPACPMLRKLKDQVQAGLGERRFTFLKAELDSGKAGGEALEQLGDIALEMQRYSEAITYYQRGSRDREDANRARRCQAKLALCYMRKRLDDMASETLREITLSLDDDPQELATIMDILYEIGNLFAEFKFYNKAEKVYKQLCKIDAGYRDVLKKVESLRAGGSG